MMNLFIYQHWGCFFHRFHDDEWCWVGHCGPDDNATAWLRLPPDQISRPEKDNNIVQCLTSSFQVFPSVLLSSTLMALSAPFVTSSGSPCRKVAAATAVLWACLCWATSWRRSKSQNAMWPWGLVDATIGGPSERAGDTESTFQNESFSPPRHPCGSCTCSKAKRADWTPVLSEAHQRLVQSDVVNDETAWCCANADHVHRRTLQRERWFYHFGENVNWPF